MKQINAFLTLQYVCLAGITAVPLIIASIISNEFKRLLPAIADIFLLSLILFVLAVTVITEISAVGKVRRLLKSGDAEKAVKMWKKMKLVSIPFYIINFIICIAFAPISFPISVVLIPLDYILCRVMIVLSGIAGIKVIAADKNDKIRPIHYVFQVLPVFDVISVLILRKRISA